MPTTFVSKILPLMPIWGNQDTIVVDGVVDFVLLVDDDDDGG